MNQDVHEKSSFFHLMRGLGIRSSRRNFLKGSLFIGSNIALSGAVRGLASAITKKRELTIAIMDEINTLYPNTHVPTTPPIIALDPMFDNLVAIGPCNGGIPKLHPQLAVSWEPVGTNWRFRLRKGVKFHNGEEFTAESAKVSIEKGMEKGSRFTSNVRLIKSVEIEDKYTIRLNTVMEYSQKPWDLRNLCMLSPKAIAELGENISKQAIGTGQFKQVEWIPGVRLVMERNDDYWAFKTKDHIGLLPENNIQRITWRTIKEPSALITALENGEIDVAQYILPHEVDRIQAKKGLRIEVVPDVRVAMLVMNQRFKPFDDVRVRKAISYGIDWKSINKFLLEGKVSDSPGPMMKQQIGYDPELKPYPYDPGRAKAYLGEAGYKNGLDLEIYATPSAVELKRVEICEAVAAQLKEIGIRLKVKSVEYGFFLSGFFQNKFPFYIFAFTTYVEPIQYFNDYFYSKGAGRTGYKNLKLDSLFEKSMEAYKAEERAKIYREIAKIVLDDAVLVWRGTLNDYRGLNDRVIYKPWCLDNYLRPSLMAIKS